MQLAPSNKGILQLDLVFSGVLIVFSILSGWYSYSELIEWNTQKGVIVLGAIPKDNQTYSISIGGRCVGELHSHFSGKTLDQFSADMTLRLKYRERDGQANTRIVLTFNPIGQFIKGDLRFEFMGLTASLLAEGVDPIKVSFDSNFLVRAQVKQEISGPLSLYETQPGQYVLSGTVLASLPKVDGMVQQLIPPEWSFRLVEGRPSEVCANEQLDLEMLSDALAARFGILNGLLKEQK